MIVRTRPREVFTLHLRHGDELALYPMASRHTAREVCDCPSAKRDAGKPDHCAGRYEFAKSAQFVEHNPDAIVWAMLIEEPKAVESEPGWFTTDKLRFAVVPIVNGSLRLPVPLSAERNMQFVIREIVKVEGQPAMPVGHTTDKPPLYKCSTLERHPEHPWNDDKHVPGVGFAYWCNGEGHPKILAAEQKRERRANLRIAPASGTDFGPEQFTRLLQYPTPEERLAQRTPGHEACDLDRTCSGGPYECLQAGDATQVLASSRVPVGVATYPMGHHSHEESAAVDFRSERDSEI